jgi:hypothetical protein
MRVLTVAAATPTIAACDLPDQHFVRGNFLCYGMFRQRGGRFRPDKGDNHGYPL